MSKYSELTKKFTPGIHIILNNAPENHSFSMAQTGAFRASPKAIKLAIDLELIRKGGMGYMLTAKGQELKKFLSEREYA